MAKLNLSLIQRVTTESKGFKCETSAGELSMTVRKLGSLDLLNVQSDANRLSSELSASPITHKDEVVHASPITCQVAVALSLAQVCADPADIYSEREIITLMVDDRFAMMALDMFDYVQEQPKND